MVNKGDGEDKEMILEKVESKHVVAGKTKIFLVCLIECVRVNFYLWTKV